MMRGFIIVGMSAVVVFAPAQAQARDQDRERAQVQPYLEIDQSALADLKNGGPVDLYTSFVGGVDASIRERNVQGQVSYRGEYRIGNNNTGDSWVHSGIARARVDAVPQLVTIDAGALATRTRTDLRGGLPAINLGNPANVSQIYAGYVGPTIAAQADGIDVNAFYRFGYTKSETETQGLTLPAGSPALGSFDSSTNHTAGASVGMRSGVLPFGWTVSVGYSRDDATQLDQRYEGKFARADVIVPVTPTVALAGGAGYEKIQSSQRDVLRNANGVPVVDSGGRYVTDPASPRLLAYDTAGLIWDVGVIWRPSPRTSLQAKAGWRYGDVTFAGAFSWEMSRSQSIQVNAYDGLQTFGGQLISSLANVPTQFLVSRDPFGGQLSGCVFGAGGGGAGACLSPALQSVSSGVYRSSGVNAIWNYRRGLWQGGVALGYNRRHFYAPTVGGFGINGVTDQNAFGQLYVKRRLEGDAAVEGNIFVNWSNSSLANAAASVGMGASGSYYRQIFRGLSGSASLGLYSTDQDGSPDTLIGAGQLGLRYTF